MKAEIECPRCDGKGYYEGEGLGNVVPCTCPPLRVPIVVHIQCECCGGTGKIVERSER